MKKNKLFKTLGCLAGISAIGSIVPAVTTSCGSSNKTKIIPEEAYAIDGNGVLTGWNQEKGWNAERVEEEGYDTMIVPEEVSKINDSAFQNTSSSFKMPALKLVLDSNLLTIGEHAFDATPLLSIDFSKCENLESIGKNGFGGEKKYEGVDSSNVATIDLSHCVNLSSIGDGAFSECRSLTSIIFPGSLNTVGDYVLLTGEVEKLRTLNIVWNDLSTNPSNLAKNAFNFGYPPAHNGTVHSTGSYSSEELLTYLKQNCKLPSTFTAAD